MKCAPVKVDDLNDLPELSYEKCPGESGCFCRIDPVVDSGSL